MSYTLEQFSADCHAALKADPGPGGRDKVRQCVERACADADFVSAYLGPENHTERKLLYEDPELKFCIFAHAYEGAKDSEPHDHGPAWAIYGQAVGFTEMSDWRVVSRPHDGKPGKVAHVRTYRLDPGQAHVYQEGDVHSPRRTGATRLIRIEGLNMDHQKRSVFEAA